MPQSRPFSELVGEQAAKPNPANANDPETAVTNEVFTGQLGDPDTDFESIFTTDLT